MMPCACTIFHRAMELVDNPRAYGSCSCDCHEILTPAEYSNLRRIADRAMLDRADNAPMLWDGRVIPYIEAINLDPALGV